MSPTTRNVLIVAASALALVAVVSVGAHAGAWYAYSSSFATGSARAERLADLASRIEPWNRSFEVRKLWSHGRARLDAGDYNSAVATLAEAYALDVGNDALLADFKRAQHIQSLETVRKAHLQHGHEGPGGTLTPQDIER